MKITRKMKASDIITTIALTGIILSGLALEQTRRQQAALDRELAMNLKVEEISRDYYLLHRLGSTNIDGLQQNLSLELANNLRTLRNSVGNVGAREQSFAQHISAFILRDEKRHPEFYLATSPSARASEQKVWHELQGEMLLPALSPASGEQKTAMLDWMQNN